MSIDVTSPKSKIGFIKSAVSVDATSCEEIHIAVANKKIKVRHLTINSGAAIDITIGEGETAGAVTTALLGPISFAANQTLQWNFNPLMELTENTSLTVDASGAGNIYIFAQGIVE